MSSRHHSAHPRRRVLCPGTAPDPVHFDVLFRADDAEPIVINDLADAASFAFDLFDLGLVDGALVLVDERRHVSAVLLDPPPSIEMMLNCALEPVIDAAFCQVLLVVARQRIVSEPPSDTDIGVYRAGQQACLTHGLLWMDLLVANPHKIQSIGIVCDPDSVWHDPIDF